MNSWIQLPKDNTSYPAARWGHSMCKLKNSMMLMFGGYAGNIIII